MDVTFRKLREIADVAQGGTLSRLRSQHGKAYPVIQISNLASLELGADGTELEQETFDPDRVAKHRVQEGQVLVSLRSESVKSSVIPPAYSSAVVGTNIAIVRPVGRVSPYYLAALFRSNFMNSRLRGLIGGTVIPSLSVKQLREFKIPVVEYHDQLTIVEAFRALEDYVRVTRQLGVQQQLRLEACLDRWFGDADASD